MRLARRMEDLTGDGGVLKQIVRQGTGPVVPQGATVRCMTCTCTIIQFQVDLDR